MAVAVAVTVDLVQSCSQRRQLHMGRRAGRPRGHAARAWEARWGWDREPHKQEGVEVR